MTILITGGMGFIGAALARRLVERGEDVVLFDIFPRTERIPDIKDKVKIVQGDLKVRSEVMNVIKENNVEGIFHLGGMLSGPCEDNPWAAFETNVAGTMYVFEGARLFGVERIVFASTAATYCIGAPKVITEETLQRPVLNYGVCKLFGELLGRFYRRKFGLDFRCLRYFQVIGPGAKPPPSTQHCFYMIQDVALGKPYECRVSEEEACVFTWYKDGIRAAEMLYYAPKEQIKTICYNVVGVPHAKTAGELAATLKEFVPDAKITFKPEPQIVQAFRDLIGMEAVDDSRAREEWGWEPLYIDLRKITEDFIQEVRTRPQIWGLA